MIVIPARLGATRLPRKPLRLLGGKPLILRVWERVVAMNAADRVVIATDSETVADVARNAGAEVALTSAEHPSGTDRVAEVATRAEYARHEVIVNVQGDEPFLQESAFRGALGYVERGTYPVGTAACHADSSVLADPSVVKVVVDSHDRALYFSRAPVPFLRDAEDTALRDGLVRRHLGVYAYTRQALARWVSLPVHPLERIERLEQLRALADGLAMGVATVAHADGPGIDTEADLILANARWTDPTPTAAGAH